VPVRAWKWCAILGFVDLLPRISEHEFACNMLVLSVLERVGHTGFVLRLENWCAIFLPLQ
jgi:hypothetical protein